MSPISGNIENKQMNMRSISSPPVEAWNKTYGNQWENTCYSVQQTTDGGYILAGSTRLFNGSYPDVWLIKTNGNGEEQWNKSYGGPKEDKGFGVFQTSDNGYLIFGNTNSYGSVNQNVWLIKTNGNGEEQWNKTIGEIPHIEAYSFQQTKDNGYIIVGKININNDFDVWLAKINKYGDVQWNTTFNRSIYDIGYSVRQTNDNGYIIVGRTENNVSDNADVWLIKTNSYGNIIWEKIYGGNEGDKGFCVQQTSDGGYIITGETQSFGSGGLYNKDVWLLKTNSVGGEEWNNTFGLGGGSDIGSTVIQLADDGYVICGHTWSYGHGWSDIWLIRTDNNGTEQWNTTFGGTKWEYGQSVIQTTDKGYIIAGWTDSFGNGEEDVWLIKLGFNNTPPTVSIENPKKGYIHFSGFPLFPTLLDLIDETITIGGFRINPIQINVRDNEQNSDELLVILVINGIDQGQGKWNPGTGHYEWNWSKRTIGNHYLKVRAEDIYGAISDWESMRIWNFCIFN
jgi:hypothetical protein